MLNSAVLNTVPLNASEGESSGLAVTADEVLLLDALDDGGVRPPLLADGLVASEALGGHSSFWMHACFLAADTLGGLLELTGERVDGVAMRDALGAIGFARRDETLYLTDGCSGTLYPVALETVVAVACRQGGVLQITASITDSVATRDRLGAASAMFSSDSLIVSDRLTGRITGGAVPLSGTVWVLDAMGGSLSSSAERVDDPVGVSDRLDVRLALASRLASTIRWADSLPIRLEPHVIVMNAETGAISTYALPLDILSVASYRDVLYAAGPDGLYALDAGRDDTGPVIWTLRTGFSNWGTDLLKRVIDVNVQGRTAGVVTCQVVTDRDGDKQQWSYELPPVNRASYRDGVIKIGKGLQSVYWQIGLRGTGPAEIDECRVSFEPLSRRR